MDKNNMPKRWEWKKLGEVAEIIMGQSPPSNTYTEKQEGLPFFQGKAEFGARFPEVRKYCSKPVRIAGQNNILMSVRAPVGSLNIADQKCCIGRGLCAIKSLQKLDYLFLYHFLKSIEKEISSKGEGSTFTAINRKDIERIEIPVPPLPIQRKIVSILERAEKLKNLRKEANGETNTIIQALFYEMFGDPQTNPKNWKITTLLEVSNEKPKYGSGASAITFDNKVRYIRITDVNEDGSLRYDSVASPSEVEDEYFLKKGDLLFARSGATVGKTYLHKEEKHNSIYAGYMIRFRFKEQICNPVFVNAITKTKYYKNWLLSNQTQVAQPNINAQQYGSFNIIIPPISLQNQFASLVEKIESIKEHQTQSTEEINTLFDALMQKAFNGELI